MQALLCDQTDIFLPSKRPRLRAGTRSGKVISHRGLQNCDVKTGLVSVLLIVSRGPIRSLQTRAAALIPSSNLPCMRSFSTDPVHLRHVHTCCVTRTIQTCALFSVSTVTRLFKAEQGCSRLLTGELQLQLSSKQPCPKVGKVGEPHSDQLVGGLACGACKSPGWYSLSPLLGTLYGDRKPKDSNLIPPSDWSVTTIEC